MGKPLSTDLRSRLIAAVAGGMSRRAAVERFGVAAASAVRWVHAHNTKVRSAPSPRAATSARITSKPFGNRQLLRAL
jgi:transposase